MVINSARTGTKIKEERITLNKFGFIISMISCIVINMFLINIKFIFNLSRFIEFG